ncbi:zinc-dependent alcohol dehydrogenase family protein [Streptomyces europaeiscabiei]|uniref:2-deoxy-scyllo-inosamine dehydrogenase n=1 Tax=Streptomyces europaeiscabiei TaxID=146819 RepID=A0ABU4NEP6_9ACTN|nr:zinc-dependent alcohol dehydrogenase family protein [Streptomyces europaeiscabiei]MDX2526873.1 zinc-dependent alcohol dehydrogenase family protein [Streptomyces europaeiscabiei]MDX2761423.1 zinc-dependent alcohol dehydrogenase family protein [Streptomyces europaeiscabiei]MDX3541370.1 zinc-dependent alcohol dehydrogenase family protein [Streptomyces europaeiscabiei]MDX3551711.1 zinc-dependent alcohol dehydrogenase family protein [Streptomyces europaeiscabiei]MDX3668974.1 zinc-dependent alcoh
MRAVVFEQFAEPATVKDVAAPTPTPHGVVVRVEATGLCRSDWHAWQGHDPDITLPHVPGHELAGVVEATGAAVAAWRPGDRVTVPFVCACGTCPACAAGDQQVCERQTQPGFTHWGSYAQYVALDHADVNLVALPDELSYGTAAALGCRFATAFRAVVTQGRVAPGEWVAVHGCGGVGLSAVMIAAASGARVIAVDVSPQALDMARKFGATECVNASAEPDTAAAIRELTGGAHLSLDALGSPATCAASVNSLRRRGRHIQVGLLPSETGTTPVPMARAIALELELLGSHGMAAHAYPQMLELVRAGVLRPDLLVTSTIPLDAAPAALAAMGTAPGSGVTVIEPWR